MKHVSVLLLILGMITAGTAWGQSAHVYLDFNLDGDLNTIQTELPPGVMSGEVSVILEAGDTPLGGLEIASYIGQGCCIAEGVTYYGTSGYFNFGYGYFDDPTHSCWSTIPQGDPSQWPCPAHLGYGCHFDHGLEFVSGERYLIGSGTWDAICDPPCTPPTEFTYRFTIGGEEVGTGTMAFDCGVPNEAVTWSCIKAIYR